MKSICLVISCEHAGNRVPPEYSNHFSGFEDLLNSHRGLDIGADELTNYLGDKLNIAVYSHRITRLLVDINRSLYRRTLFSEITKGISKEKKMKILNQYYYPHRNKVEQKIKSLIEGNQFVLHITVHSFTPVLHGIERRADIGILYNPERQNEKNFAKIWKSEMQLNNQDLVIRFNYPYRGKPDGFPAYFRKKYKDELYAGYEFEVNQKYYTNKNYDWSSIKDTILYGLIEAVRKYSKSLGG